MPAVNQGGWAGYDRYYFGTTYGTIQRYTNAERKLMRDTAGSGYGKRRFSALMKALVGNTVGASKVATEKRRLGFNEIGTIGPSSGGRVAMEIYTIQSGVTTTADVNRIQTVLNPTMMPVFAVNRDGIGLPTNGRTSSI